jgi:hypothetical protein
MSEIRPSDSSAPLSPSPISATRCSTSAPPKHAAGECPSPERSAGAADASLAPHNLRGVAIAFVRIQHSFVAYLASIQSSGNAFERPPYQWLAIPILDRSRWLGFDIFCAWQDAYLMSLMFFLSGVFTWRSLERSGDKRFLANPQARRRDPVRRRRRDAARALSGLSPVRRGSEPCGNMRSYLSLPFIPNGRCGSYRC